MARGKRRARAGRRIAAPLTPPLPVRAAHPRGAVRHLLGILVVLSLAGSTAGLTLAHKSVRIDDDGTVRAVSAYGRTVGDVLRFQGIDTQRGDLVTPDASSPAHDGEIIVVRSSREVTLEVDGKRTTFVTNALTVGDLISALGERGDGAVATASRSDALGRDPIRVSTQKVVHVSVDGAVLPVTTTAATVRDVLDAAGITLGEQDGTSVPLGAAAVDGMVVIVQRGSTGSDTVTEVVPFETKTIEEPALPQGYRKVRTTGRVGEAVTTYTTRSLGGAEVERTVLTRDVTREPRTEAVVVGTMDPSKVVSTPSAAKDTARALLAERGWGDDQMACLDSLWTKESGWRVDANNPSSSAYGIPQALPGSKMASAGPDWQTNAATQITWGLGYISGRYGTPCDAWAFWLAKGYY